MITQGKVLEKVEVEIWAEPAEGVTLEQAIADARALGNEVLEIDRARNRFKLVHLVEEG